MDVIEIREDVVPDERAHEIIVMNQVDAQYCPGDAVDHRAEEVRPRQEVKKQRNRQRDVQDHGKMSGSLQENILMQQKSHRVKGQYRHKQEQHHREETAQIAFMLPRLQQRGTVQPQITADGKELFAGSSTRKTPCTPKWQEMMTSMAMIRNNSNDKLRGRILSEYRFSLSFCQYSY